MKKRGQHYVWKHYLKQWTTNGKLFCLRENKVFETNPDNIANKRDFYRLEELTANEMLFISRIIDMMPTAFREVRLGWLNHFNSVFKVKKYMNLWV